MLDQSGEPSATAGTGGGGGAGGQPAGQELSRAERNGATPNATKKFWERIALS
jgi:hypothetical protein